MIGPVLCCAFIMLIILFAHVRFLNRKTVLTTLKINQI